MIVKLSTLTLLAGTTTNALLVANESSSRLTLQNDRLIASVVKAGGAIDTLYLDGQNLLGTRSGSTGLGPYLDCYCTPSGFYTPGSIAPRYQLLNGTDSTGTPWGGIVLIETYPATGQILEQYWFLREGETGLHMFSRLVYHNATTPFLRNLQEFRTLMRPNTKLWTHLSTNEDQYAPLPYNNPATGSTGNATTVQDATWRINNSSDPYVQQESDYFTKYTFSDVWRDHKAHGLFSDGSTSSDGSTFGAWFVMNTHDTYFGGPTHSDLTVDGIVYNYIVSNHHGAQTPNITDGFDRTFGPGYYYFNKGAADAGLEELRLDAEKYADASFAEEFYDSIAEFVPGYVPSSGRGSWNGKIDMPHGAEKPVAILSLSGVEYQNNAHDAEAYQYWAEIDGETGEVSIDRVKSGTYRLTVYASGVFGQYEQDNIVITAGEDSATEVSWKQESSGLELWRVGTPDKSSGEYRHGYAKDPTHPLHPAEHRIYWAAYDFVDDFPEGVRFEVGKDDVAQDLNYVHWSVFGGYANSVRPDRYYGDGNVNNWTLLFDVNETKLQNRTSGVFTVQLAAAKTAAGNTDVFNATQPFSNLPLTVSINGQDLEPWIIPYYHSSSCAVRSAVICYNLAHKFEFDITLLENGSNELVLSLPFNATDYESALLPESVYVQYDALRLEVQ
ncbi:Putative Galactose-binding-like domain superfamily, galactose mutarotase-like domain superfamily [Septoria linicola]|uniref:rhamnogalacturonan endolyase n=1 Tax=Septoria linicola TaxID=215465 RepID=A0A9Q9EQT4_9PEZI|nr:Putative Galactose-binding-like domain superfamily, galactose mutarotase-like domain superfamily [Septoria linicola]